MLTDEQILELRKAAVLQQGVEKQAITTLLEKALPLILQHVARLLNYDGDSRLETEENASFLLILSAQMVDVLQKEEMHDTVIAPLHEIVKLRSALRCSLVELEALQEGDGDGSVSRVLQSVGKAALHLLAKVEAAGLVKEKLETAKVDVEKLFSRSDAAATQLQDVMKTRASEVFDSICESLTPLRNGAEDGKSWKESLPRVGASIKDVVRAANATILNDESAAKLQEANKSALKDA